jgi:hypothetical protein
MVAIQVANFRLFGVVRRRSTAQLLLGGTTSGLGKSEGGAVRPRHLRRLTQSPRYTLPEAFSLGLQEPSP